VVRTPRSEGAQQAVRTGRRRFDVESLLVTLAGCQGMRRVLGGAWCYFASPPARFSFATKGFLVIVASLDLG